MKYHSEVDCCVKLEAIRTIMEGFKNDMKDPINLHVIETVLELVRELRGELNNNKE